MEGPDSATERAEMLERWEQAATGWGKRAARLRQVTMPVSAWLIEQLALQPGYRVLELAAGPGDTGFLAAELVLPGGSVICSDGAKAMLELARERARTLGIENVEFKHLELEWIDLPTASVDAALCRWGLMLSVDPAAAVQEMRRVLKPRGRATVAVWDQSEHNPWATITGRALIELGFASPPDPKAPGMFALSQPGRLQELFEEGGFLDVRVQALELSRSYPSEEAYLQETLDVSRLFADRYEPLDEPQRAAVRQRIGELVKPLSAPDGSLRLPGRSLVAAATA